MRLSETKPSWWLHNVKILHKISKSRGCALIVR
jgi:hypothetical protein